MIVIDAHVHIYDCFDLDMLLDSALANFKAAVQRYHRQRQRVAYFLLLAEGLSYNSFQRLSALVAEEKYQSRSCSENWSIRATDERNTLLACRDDASDNRIYLVAGRQVVTAEKLEVLALFSEHLIEDGMTLDATVDVVRTHNAIAVIPWGVGKWFGRRGKALKNLLDRYHGTDLFLGDNGGRPVFWPTPFLFHYARKKGVGLLSGSDPLPLPSEATRVGSFVTTLNGECSHAKPAEALKSLLTLGNCSINQYGPRLNMHTFFHNQLKIKIRAHK